MKNHVAVLAGTILAIAIPLAGIAQASLITEDDGRALWVYDGDTPVLAYHHQDSPLPEGVEERFRRAGYIHPLVGLDGEILSQDFPSDHYHHRGIFWAWPETIALGRKLDTWGLSDAAQRPVKWESSEGENGTLLLHIEQYSYFKDAPDTPILDEKVTVTIHPVEGPMRAIDFELRFTNATSEDLILQGQDDKDKGYGGFGVRPNATRKPFRFLGANGRISSDRLEEPSPWADVSFSLEPGRRNPRSGFALFQHPENPGYPHPGYLMRHFGFLGHSWPHREPHTLAPSEDITLRYRLVVHRQDGRTLNLDQVFEAYEAEAQKAAN